jgi:hypothetical protein
MSKSPNKHYHLYFEARPLEEGLAEAIDDGHIGPRVCVLHSFLVPFFFDAITLVRFRVILQSFSVLCTFNLIKFFWFLLVTDFVFFFPPGAILKSILITIWLLL